MKKNRWFTIVVSLIVLSMILSACAKTATPTETATEAPTTEPVKNTIIIGVTDTIASLDPADAYATHDWELIKNTGEGLFKWKPGTAELQLGLAADWPVVSEDGLTYTFKLREGIKFADGLALTAPLFAEQLNRLLTIGPGETCPNGVASALAVPYVEKIEATDDVTIVFTLKAAIGFFNQILATAPYVPAHPSIFTAASCNLFPTAPVYGVGPWYISQYTQAEQLVMEPNPYYNGELKPQVDQVIIRYIADPQTLSLAVQNGEIDVAWRFMGPELISGLEEVANLTVGTVDAGPIRILTINHTFAPMDDSNVRKAVAAAIDRDEISDVVYSGKAAPLYSMVPPGFLGASEAFDALYESPNLDLAKEFLAASGYTAEAPLALDLWYPPEHYGAETAAWMEVIKQQLEATGAIKVTLNAQEWSTYITNLVSGQAYPAGVMGWFFDYPDSSNYMDPFVFNDGMGTMVALSTEGSTFGEPVNETAATLIDLLAQADVETDAEARAELYRQAQDVYADLVVSIPLFMIAEHVTFNQSIKGSASYPAAEALNIGPTMEFNYSTLTKTP